MTITLRGLPAAPGIGIGTLIVYRPGLISLDLAQVEAAGDPRHEWQRFLDAHARVDTELEQLGHHANTLVAEIFAAHRVILHDQTLLDSVRAAIFDHSRTAVSATHCSATRSEPAAGAADCCRAAPCSAGAGTPTYCWSATSSEEESSAVREAT